MIMPTLTAPMTGIWPIRGFSVMRRRPRMYRSQTPARIPKKRAIIWPTPKGSGKLGSGLICKAIRDLKKSHCVSKANKLSETDPKQ